MENSNKSHKPKEQEAVYTTIVGGRPPGSGTQTGDIPRGIEVLVKKASVDPEFYRLLLEKRAHAAKEIDLELSSAETEMLTGIPVEQLKKIIDNVKVKPENVRIFLGKKAKLMLATAAGLAVVSMISVTTYTAGTSPDRVRQIQIENNLDPTDPKDPNDPNSPDSNQGEISQSEET